MPTRGQGKLPRQTSSSSPRQRNASARRGRSGVPLSRLRVPVLPLAGFRAPSSRSPAFSSNRHPAAPRGARAYVAAMGGHPSSPATFVSIHANLASPGRKELPGFRKDDRGSACEPVQGPNAYNVVLRVFVMEVLDRSRPLPHISCGYPDTPPPDIDLQHASR